LKLEGNPYAEVGFNLGHEFADIEGFKVIIVDANWLIRRCGSGTVFVHA